MIPLDEYCLQLRKRIEAAYIESGNDLGWRLLSSPADVLDGADIAFIGINPGGSCRPADHAEFSMSHGSAYVVETWGGSNEPGMNPLQTQVRALFKKLGVEPEDVLAGNLVPFRSQCLEKLKNRTYSLHFGEALWADIFQRAKPKLVIGMGRTVHRRLLRILHASNERSVPIGWGRVSGTRAKFPGGRLVILPHLSRFGVVTRDESAEALRNLFGEHLLA